jgi:hypothetical protein
MVGKSTDRCPRCGARIEYFGRIGIGAYNPAEYRCSNPWCPDHGEPIIGTVIASRPNTRLW